MRTAQSSARRVGGVRMAAVPVRVTSGGRDEATLGAFGGRRRPTQSLQVRNGGGAAAASRSPGVVCGAEEASRRVSRGSGGERGSQRGGRGGSRGGGGGGGERSSGGGGSSFYGGGDDTRDAGRAASGRIQGDLTSATHPQDILAIVGADGEAFDAIHTATAIHRLATHGSRTTRDKEDVTRNPQFKALMLLVDKNLTKMNSQGLANVAGACARLEHNPGVDLFRNIAAGLEKELLEVAKAAAAAGNNNGRGELRAAPGGRRPREVRPQAVSNTLWAFGQLRYKPEDATLKAGTDNRPPFSSI